MRLIKSHGLGNDYLVLASGEPLDTEVVRALCDRHRGVGADGVLEPLPSAQADFGLRIWNPDGSQAEKSGNGLRIFARFLVDHRGAPAGFTVEVPGGIVHCEVDADGVTVQMGRAVVSASEVVAGHRVIAVDIGNPHCVVFVDEELDSLPWRDWGRTLEVHPRFPNRTNVQVARVADRGRVEARIWERGAGETLASGSSACAVAAAAQGPCDGAVEVVMEGGSLLVEVTPDLQLTLRGPVEEIAAVEVSDEWVDLRNQGPDGYDAAMRRFLALEPRPLKASGSYPSRDDVHDRGASRDREHRDR